MLFALLAALFFACSGVCGQRSSSMVGPVKANFLRLLFASVVLTGATLALGGVDLGSPAARRLYLSGLAGFGLGDMALFFALPRLGARLTLLINLCTAPLFGSLGDYLLLGTGVRPVHGLACALILGGVVLALQSRRPAHLTAHPNWLGAGAALLAGFGQGTGASLSRYAHAAQIIPLHSAVETCLRVIPGCLTAGMFWLVRRRSQKIRIARPVTPVAAGWIIANALFGAVIGVSCFQHALTQASSAVVLSITATTPILVMPMTFYSESDQPSMRSIGGAIMAVMGVVVLKLLT